METLDQHVNSSDSGIKVSQDAKSNFITIGKWTRFLGVIGFISVGLLGIAALFMIIVGGSSSYVGEQMMFLGLIYLIMAGIYVFPALYLVRTANHLLEAFERDKVASFEMGVENLKSFFKFVGIFTIVVMSMYILILLFAMVAGASRGF